jgi:hypothetical protein
VCSEEDGAGWLTFLRSLTGSPVVVSKSYTTPVDVTDI